MNPNPFLARRGYSPQTRFVIFHADDIGMCHATQAAYDDLVHAGTISSAAVMVPCPWFAATAAFYREHKNRLPGLDLGVHLTLTSEFAHYRWGPLTNSDDEGIIDEAGFFHQECAPVQENGPQPAVYAELAAQFDRALNAGIDVTHIDTHMGCVYHQRLLPTYLQLMRERRVPALLPRPQLLKDLEMDNEQATLFTEILTDLEKDDLPLLDSIHMLPLDQPHARLEQARTILEDLPPGLNYFIIHPARETPELKAITADWAARVADYMLFMSDEWRRVVNQSGVKAIGWRAIREMMGE